MVKNCLPVQETICLGGKDPLKDKMASCSSILAWKLPWPEEPGGLWLSMRMHVRTYAHRRARARTVQGPKPGNFWLPLFLCLLLHWACKSFDLTGMKISFWPYLTTCGELSSPTRDWTEGLSNARVLNTGPPGHWQIFFLSGFMYKCYFGWNLKLQKLRIWKSHVMAALHCILIYLPFKNKKRNLA